MCSYRRTRSLTGATLSWGSMTSRLLKADQTLADLVAGEMQGDELLSQEDITVHAKGGTVTLKGTVEDVAVLDRAIKVAAGTEGVSMVKSRLEVEIKN